MKKLLLFFSFMQSSLLLIGQNLNDNISVVTWSYTMTGSYDEVKLFVTNYSGCNIRLFNVFAVDASTNEIFFSEINSSSSLNSNSSKSYQFSRSNYGSLSHSGWYLNIVYLNLNDGKLYHKAVVKKANSYGSNVSLKDATPLPNNGCINNDISVYLRSLSFGYYNGVLQEDLELSLINNSSQNMTVQTVFAYDTAFNNIFSSDCAPNLNINGNSNGIAKVTYQNSNYLMSGAYYVSLIYTCNNEVYMKTVLKSANVYDTTIALEDVSQEYSVALADYSGNCGNNVTYTYVEATQTLIVSGNGEIANYTQGGAPWYDIRTQIKHLIVESGVKTIGNFSFCDCQNLESVSLSEGIEYINCYAFSQCGMLEMSEIIIPNSVIEIQSCAFWLCRKLNKVILGKGLKTIGPNAFQGALTNKVYCFATTPPNISSNSFENKHVLYVPQESINTYKTTSGWKDFNVILSIPDEAGINVVKDAQDNMAVIYNLNGVRLSKPQKGINVVNGKKMVSK